MDQSFRAGEVYRLRVGNAVEHARRERARQQALRLDRPRVERQRALEQADSLGINIP